MKIQLDELSHMRILAIDMDDEWDVSATGNSFTEVDVPTDSLTIILLPCNARS